MAGQAEGGKWSLGGRNLIDGHETTVFLETLAVFFFCRGGLIYIFLKKIIILALLKGHLLFLFQFFFPNIRVYIRFAEENVFLDLALPTGPALWWLFWVISANQNEAT